MAWVQSLAWELPHAADMVKKKGGKIKNPPTILSQRWSISYSFITAILHIHGFFFLQCYNQWCLLLNIICGIILFGPMKTPSSEQAILNCICFLFLGLHLGHMEVPGLRVKLELQLKPMPQPQQRQIRAASDLHCSLWHCWILNPLSKTRDWTTILMDTRLVLNPLTHSGNS